MFNHIFALIFCSVAWLAKILIHSLSKVLTKQVPCPICISYLVKQNIKWILKSSFLLLSFIFEYLLDFYLETYGSCSFYVYLFVCVSHQPMYVFPIQVCCNHHEFSSLKTILLYTNDAVMKHLNRTSAALQKVSNDYENINQDKECWKSYLHWKCEIFELWLKFKFWYFINSHNCWWTVITKYSSIIIMKIVPLFILSFQHHIQQKISF